MKKVRIIVVGAGPVGVVAALACAQNEFAVTLLEAEIRQTIVPSGDDPSGDARDDRRSVSSNCSSPRVS